MPHMLDVDQKDFEYKMSKTILLMPEEVQDRFKAIKVLYDTERQIDDEEEALYRALELKYDALYREVYEERKQVLAGTKLPAEDALAQFNVRAKELDDEDFKKLEVQSCDVKDIQNCPTGVPGFWLRSMLNHGGISRLIQEKDRPILMHLQDIDCKLHDPGYGFDLIFTFEKNDYFKNEKLSKSFTMERQNMIEKCEGSEIEWKDGKDVTKKKIKKKQKAKKGKPGQTITKVVEQESFFNFFKTREMPDEKELAEGKITPKEKGEDDEDGVGEKDAAELMDEDFDLGNEFKDQLIPLALEYYLEVIEEDDEDGCEDEDCEDDDCPDTSCKPKKGGKKGKDSDGDDDEEDQKPAKGSKKGGKGGAAPGGQQQECKQQ